MSEGASRVGAPRALLFGAGGQDGHYVAEACRARGYVPILTSRHAGHERCDVGDFELVAELVDRHGPELVFQLAATSTTHHEALFENQRSIATGTLNVLEAVRRHSPQAKVFVTGSGVQFVNPLRPISERDPFEASSPYAVARIEAAYAARYFRRQGVRAYVGYLFHHESPRRSPRHVSRLVVDAARRIRGGDPAPLRLGDVSVEKEWTYAGDVAEGILTLLGQDDVFEATIGSGQTHSIAEWLETCFRQLGLDWREHVISDPDFTPEYPRLVSDPTTIRSLGWEPQAGLLDLARMMLEG